jgi:hypothetical protein
MRFIKDRLFIVVQSCLLVFIQFLVPFNMMKCILDSFPTYFNYLPLVKSIHQLDLCGWEVSETLERRVCDLVMSEVSPSQVGKDLLTIEKGIEVSANWINWSLLQWWLWRCKEEFTGEGKRIQNRGWTTIALIVR